MKKKCDNCDKKFNYIDIFKSQLTFKLTCPKCNQEYILKQYSRLFISLLTALPLFFINKLISRLGGYIILVYISWYLILLAIMPFFYQFKKVSKDTQ